jgi:pimeloyl-ACP methyl ester carboxylesterase
VAQEPEAGADAPKCLADPLEWFDKWREENHEPVPDFGEMRSIPDVPRLLEFYDGTPVTSRDDWEKRRAEIEDLLCQTILGTLPDSPPKLVGAKVLQESKERGCVRRIIQVEFDTNPRSSFTMEVFMPEGPGPFPVFLTQDNHRRVGLIGLTRGYLVCVYPGADTDDRTDAFKKAYPEEDWSLLTRRAWLGSRALDYIQTLPEANMEQVAITGHSRNGKQSLIATAFDPRIKAVVSSSSGTGGATPFRYVSENAYGESVQFMSRNFPEWFHPRIRFYTGRENKLPIDIDGLLGLIAPRYCLISTAINDGVESTFAIERGYRNAMEVYEFLDAPDALRIAYRSGSHEWGPDTAQMYFDWFDRAFGRGNAEFAEELFHDFTWDDWKASQDSEELEIPEKVSTDSSREEKEAVIQWALGEAPPAHASRGGSYGREVEHLSRMMNRDSTSAQNQGVQRLAFSFGEYRRGNLYYKEDSPNPLPVVIWLHPYCFSKGYTGAYVRGEKIFNALAQEGYAVLAFDQLGFGTRLGENPRFYDRYPEWSKLGAMIRDVEAAVDFLLEGEGRFPEDPHSKEELDRPPIDTAKIYCLGYSLGGMVGLYATALDDRIAGVASYCGFTPMRTDTDEKPTGGIRRYWEWFALQPRLGLFQGREVEIPYDWQDVLSLIAPRPCLIVSPIHDREADHGDIEDCVQVARTAWQDGGLTHLSPDNYNRFEPEQYEMVIEWLGRITPIPN